MKQNAYLFLVVGTLCHNLESINNEAKSINNTTSRHGGGLKKITGIK